MTFWPLFVFIFLAHLNPTTALGLVNTFSLQGFSELYTRFLTHFSHDSRTLHTHCVSSTWLHCKWHLFERCLMDGLMSALSLISCNCPPPSFCATVDHFHFSSFQRHHDNAKSALPSHCCLYPDKLSNSAPSSDHFTQHHPAVFLCAIPYTIRLWPISRNLYN